jgi:uncharacterized membrane protein YjjP (DUF1212 family)
VIPAVKVALGLSDAGAQLTFSVALFGMAFATLFYGSLSDAVLCGCLTSIAGAMPFLQKRLGTIPAPG